MVHRFLFKDYSHADIVRSLLKKRNALFLCGMVSTQHAVVMPYVVNDSFMHKLKVGSVVVLAGAKVGQQSSSACMERMAKAPRACLWELTWFGAEHKRSSSPAAVALVALERTSD